jgi:ribosomal protein S18 acetylase RimI-like enzyme
MRIDQLQHEDVDDLLLLAGAEGWLCESWEFEFLLRVFPGGCLVARDGDAPVGFITSIKYGTSSWIGNLIVRPELRGKGIGTDLMRRVLASLAEAGARTVWLTASMDGKPVYERLGFVEVDAVERWCGMASCEGESIEEDDPMVDVLAVDIAGWGDTRQEILDVVTKRGTMLARSEGFLVKQPCGDALQFGPWGAIERQTAERLFAAALTQSAPGARIFLDVPVRNVDAASILHTVGFSIRGSTTLMYLGERPAYDPARIYALASMGSMG